MLLGVSRLPDSWFVTPTPDRFALTLALFTHPWFDLLQILGSSLLTFTYQLVSAILVTPGEGYHVQSTGGKGVFTWWAHGEFIVSSETIHPPITHQAHAGYFLKEFINLPTWYPPGTWWVLFKSAYDSTQWKRHG